MVSEDTKEYYKFLWVAPRLPKNLLAMQLRVFFYLQEVSRILLTEIPNPKWDKKTLVLMHLPELCLSFLRRGECLVVSSG